ncbi:hypothetical protein DEM27_21270 [Metarhizobium album]|uniref:DUF4214 domain-containing protein n=1 Tax=Metarhizobium album TaxID=2182425 RepID=A0A2U2DLS2_9HYPH|nr:DUF4214 domain-containing protein [Rhizobium album]PWE54239.1 hypothetical protein DEM27_21270 [Rhizobium album]
MPLPSYLTRVFMGHTIGEKQGFRDYEWDRSVAVDIDGDGRQEVIVSGLQIGVGNARTESRPLLVLSYDGNGLVDATERFLPDKPSTILTRNFIVADFNGDGIQDVFVNNHGTEGTDPFPGEQNRLLLSTGNGTYSDKSGNLPQLTDFSHGSVAADFDGDGDVDLYVNNLGEDDNTGSYILLNDGSGRFGAPIFYGRDDHFSDNTKTFLSSYHANLMDADADGLPDIYFGQTSSWNNGPVFAGFSYLKNDGKGNFTLIFDEELGRNVPSPSSIDNSSEFTVSGDVDNDGDLDLLVLWSIHAPANGTFIQYLRNDGIQGYTDASMEIAGQAGGQMLEAHGGQPLLNLVDLEGDGDLDIVFSNYNESFTGQVTFWFANDGAGHFSRIDEDLFPATESYEFADVNGDWIADAVYAVADWNPPPDLTIKGPPSGNDYAAVQIAVINEAVSRTGWQTNDRIAGGNGNDSLTGLGGNDQLNGNGGLDTAIYRGAREDYDVGRSAGNTISVLDKIAGRDGSDTLFNFERVHFSDGTLAFDTAGAAGQAYRIYQAAFDRTPDTAGLSHWIKAMDTGMSLQSAADGFVSSAEFQALYGTNVSNQAFVEQLYQNVLGRAGEQAGIDFWTGRMAANVSRAEVLAGFSESAENIAGVAPAIADGIWYV